MYRTKREFDVIKNALRQIEGILEVALLAVIYYAIWRNFYNEADFPTYHGNGKYLLMAVYAMVVIVLFRLGDGFKFGDLKMTDILISQSVSLFVANIITYFQLCLIANRMVSLIPMFSLMLIDTVVRLEIWLEEDGSKKVIIVRRWKPLIAGTIIVFIFHMLLSTALSEGLVLSQEEQNYIDSTPLLRVATVDGAAPLHLVNTPYRIA